MSRFPGTVVLQKDPKLRSKDGSIRPERMRPLFDAALCRLCGTETGSEAWKKLLSPGDIIGIKVNCLSGRVLSTRPELVAAMIDSLADAGVSKKRIIIWDRTNRELAEAGFPIRTSGEGPLCFGTDQVGYERRLAFSGEVGSCLSKILTRSVSVLINAGVLKDHNLAGVSAAMKNLFGIIHNPNKYHDNTCDPYVADVSNLATVKRKLKLTVVDGTLAQYHNGPAYSPAYAWRCNSVLAATDAVALDRVACDILDKKRKENNIPGFREAGLWPAWLDTAAKYGLGEADLATINLKEGSQ